MKFRDINTQDMCSCWIICLWDLNVPLWWGRLSVNNGEKRPSFPSLCLLNKFDKFFPVFSQVVSCGSRTSYLPFCTLQRTIFAKEAWARGFYEPQEATVPCLTLNQILYRVVVLDGHFINGLPKRCSGEKSACQCRGHKRWYRSSPWAK